MKQTVETAIVNVAVATLWSEPGLNRPIDTPSATFPVDIRLWTRSMTTPDKLWLVGNLNTQALYGNRVSILNHAGDFVEVAVHGQPGLHDEIGYTGWMPDCQLIKNHSFLKEMKGPFVVVKSQTTFLYEDPSLKNRMMEVSFNTRLPFLYQSEDAYQVLQPNGNKAWIGRLDSEAYQSVSGIPVPSGEQLVKIGRQFLGLPYLWSGMSGFGFDCSGFTYTLYHFCGITIPRDAFAQAESGLEIAKSDLQPGDLVFFKNDGGKGRVHHVAMYAGDGYILHSPNTPKSIECIPLETGKYAEEYAGARRYI